MMRFQSRPEFQATTARSNLLSYAISSLFILLLILPDIINAVPIPVLEVKASVRARYRPNSRSDPAANLPDTTRNPSVNDNDDNNTPDAGSSKKTTTSRTGRKSSRTAKPKNADQDPTVLTWRFPKLMGKLGFDPDMEVRIGPGSSKSKKQASTRKFRTTLLPPDEQPEPEPLPEGTRFRARERDDPRKMAEWQRLRWGDQIHRVLLSMDGDSRTTRREMYRMSRYSKGPNKVWPLEVFLTSKTFGEDFRTEVFDDRDSKAEGEAAIIAVLRNNPTIRLVTTKKGEAEIRDHVHEIFADEHVLANGIEVRGPFPTMYFNRQAEE